MENELIIELEGIFKHCIYKSDSFMVTKFDTEDGLITVTGPSFDYEKGSKYILFGNYFDHPRYGFQFKYIRFDKSIPKQKDEIINFLSSSLFKGVGKKAAEKIYTVFGDNAINIIKDDVEVLNNVNLTNKQLQALKEGFLSLNDPLNDTIFFLLSNGFNNLDAQKIIAKFKLASKEIADINPFRYYTEVYGISFDKVRYFASTREFEDKENKFKEAYLIYLITETNFNTGDTYIDKDYLINLLIKNGIDNTEEIIDYALSDNYIVIEENRVYLSDDYNNEFIISDRLNNFMSDIVVDNRTVDRLIDEYEDKNHIVYDTKQIDAIRNFFTNSFSLIVGGPGTGKTTIIKSMVEMYKELFPYNNIIVTAPTGRASKRIAEICEVESKTIHSLLKWNKEANTFVYNDENPIMYDALIIDEFSMVDADLFASLLKASKKVKKLCIIGDDNQLPSIRQGACLKDIINAEKYPLTRLNVNFRQNDGSEIISLASSIINQEVDLSRYKNDVIYIDYHKQDFNLIELINNDLKVGYTIDDIQVLTPMKKGKYGIENLNIILQEAYNPKELDKNEKSSSPYIFRETDKVIQLKNRPVDDVYNGDVGKIVDIDLHEKSILVDYQGTFVYYTYDELIDLSLAYALTVHKSQGSEYQIVYFIISSNNLHMLNKNLIYTAVTRAKKKLIIVGSEDLLIQGIRRNQKERNTTLTKRLLNI